jgi:hypothetical protein
LVSQVDVYRIASTLKVARTCETLKDEKCTAAASTNKCGSMPDLPADHLASLTIYKENGEQEELASGPGVADTDLIIYITGSAGCSPADPNTALASGNVCHRDQNNRPIAGFIDICQNQIEQGLNSDAVQESIDVGIVVHEIIHILGMSTRSFSLFWDQNGNPRTKRCPGHPLCLATDRSGFPPKHSDGEFLIDQTTLNGTWLVTPTVADVAREHFQCKELVGAELHSEGGNMHPHWQQKALMPEIMTAGRWPG